jgi:glutathionyl-hydroquinone reductase
MCFIPSPFRSRNTEQKKGLIYKLSLSLCTPCEYREGIEGTRGHHPRRRSRLGTFCGRRMVCFFLLLSPYFHSYRKKQTEIKQRSFTGRDGTALDTLYGFKHLKDFYFKANPDYVGRYTVPTLWDKKLETIVSNESSEIIRMFYSAFDELLPAPLREVNKPHGGLLPPHLKEKIDEMNEWVYSDLTTGVYKAGFASTQAMYEENVLKVFKALDKVEKILGESEGKYVFGDSLTEADIRLYPTIVRFDVAYFSLFQCNLRMIRFAYPRVQKWLMGLYYSEEEDIRGVFGAKTTCFDHVGVPLLFVFVFRKHGLMGVLAD